MGIEELKKELRKLQDKRQEDATIKNLKRQIRTEKFGQTKTGKVFNKIADIGDAGLRATTRYLSQPNKKKKRIKTVEEVMKRLPQ